MKYFLAAALTITILFTPALALAATFENPLGFSDPQDAIRDIISSIITFILSLSAFIALATITYGGLRLILGSATSEQDVAKAKIIILWSVIGLVVIGISTAILRAIQTIL